MAEAKQTIRRNRAYIASAMNAPILSREHEQHLALRWRDDDDEEALHELISSYLRLVISTAARFRNYGLPMGDLVQEGNVGLMQAAVRFEPEREVRFSTYASWWIRSAMQEYVLRNWSVVRTGTSASQKSLFFNLRWLRSKIDNGTGGAPTPEKVQNIATALGVKTREVEMMIDRLSSRDQSLNEPIGEEGADEWEDFLVDDGDSPESIVVKSIDHEIQSKWLFTALDELSDREQMIIRERRLKEDRVTLEELGQKLGITKERVRQIEHKAFEKLQNAVLKLSDQNRGRYPLLS